MLKTLLSAVTRKKQPPELPLEDRLEEEKRKEAGLESSNPAPVVDVTDADFADVVLASEKLTVVDFWADWCQPCTIMSAYMNFLAKDFGDELLVAALDVEENPQTAEQFSVMGLPTLIYFRDGAEVERIVGVVEYEELNVLCQQILRPD